jgi:hypothetical protein
VAWLVIGPGQSRYSGRYSSEDDGTSYLECLAPGCGTIGERFGQLVKGVILGVTFGVTLGIVGFFAWVFPLGHRCSSPFAW